MIQSIDFVSPLEIRSGSGTKQILSMESCSEHYRQITSPDKNSTSTGGIFAPTSWEQGDETWKTDNSFLLNRGDQACVMIVSELADASNSGVYNPPSWSARIKNYQLKPYDSYQTYFENNNQLIDHFLVGVSLTWLGVYCFLILFAILLFWNLWIARTSSWLNLNTKTGVLRCIGIALLCISTSEILTDFFVNRRGDIFNPSFLPIPHIAWILLIIHFLFVIYLMWSRRKIDQLI